MAAAFEEPSSSGRPLYLDARDWDALNNTLQDQGIRLFCSNEPKASMIALTMFVDWMLGQGASAPSSVTVFVNHKDEERNGNNAEDGDSRPSSGGRDFAALEEKLAEIAEDHARLRRSESNIATKVERVWAPEDEQMTISLTAENSTAASEHEDSGNSSDENQPNIYSAEGEKTKTEGSFRRGPVLSFSGTSSSSGSSSTQVAARGILPALASAGSVVPEEVAGGQLCSPFTAMSLVTCALMNQTYDGIENDAAHGKFKKWGYFMQVVRSHFLKYYGEQARYACKPVDVMPSVAEEDEEEGGDVDMLKFNPAGEVEEVS
ncbi:unnamed protein product [Amoebophrya sp. A25]|nr:unnamed protein product [Amoebophrya sp. A25]|eukprot:GSA25T00002217001.1